MTPPKSDTESVLLQDMPPEQYVQLTRLIREVVKDVVQEAVRTEMANYQHTCRLKISSEEMEGVAQFAHRMSQLGEGSVQQGFDLIYENHKWMKTQREVGAKLSFSLLFLFLTGLASGLLAALWLGIKALITRGQV